MTFSHVEEDWIEYRRRSDRERLGWLIATDDGFIPVSLLGWPLGEASDLGDAEQRLDDEGIGYLADVWILDTDQGEQRVRFKEVTPDQATLITDNFGAIDVPFTEFVVPIPAPTTLHRR